MQGAYSLAQIALEAKHPPHTIRFALGGSCVKLSTLPEHSLFHLLGDNGSDFAEIFPNGVYFQGGAHQEFQIAFKIARRYPGKLASPGVA